MRILILGATGFLGRHLCAFLGAQGHEITAVARHAPVGDFPPVARFVQATIDDRLALTPVLAEADFAVHLAWDTTPGTSHRQPVLETTNNTLPTMRLLEMLQEHPACGLVFLSSGGALYASTDRPIAENGQLAPRSCYGAGKAAVELMLQAFNAQSGNRVVILRPSNVYGPGQTAKRSFGIVPTLMHCARTGAEFEIWGSGETARDYLYVGDFERLTGAVLSHPWPEGVFARINAGTGSALSIDRLCDLVGQAAGTPVRRVARAARSIDPACIRLDATLARELFGWRPETPIEDGLQRTWHWYAERK
jgi:UDP-glucose 4-epimerase